MIWPPWTRPAIVGAAILVVLILAWVYWPAPGPSPAEEALKQQNEALIKINEKLAADAAARTAEAQKLREDADAKLEEIAPIRAQRRAARRDGAARSSQILATPDERAADAVRVQLDRTRRAIRAIRPAAESSEGIGTESHRR